MKFILRILMILLAGSLLGSCKAGYSLTGASIAPDVKTINIKFFPKTAPLGPASLGQTFTEKLKDKFISQTSLTPAIQNADLTLEGTITGYTVAPISIQSNETAAQNRLTITVSVKFTNIKDEKQNYESTFSRYADFDSGQNISAVEDVLIGQINEQLVDDIFNKSVINW